MTLKKNKNKNYDPPEETDRPREDRTRRSNKNWTKVWNDHQENYEEIDDFHVK